MVELGRVKVVPLLVDEWCIVENQENRRAFEKGVSLKLKTLGAVLKIVKLFSAKVRIVQFE
jgi:hypothetical protein